MQKHHAESIDRVVDHFANCNDILALLLTGSLAHGFSRPASDVDITIVVTASDYESRKLSNSLTYYNDGLCTYPGGYVDGKYVDTQFIQDVASHGSEPARFAFKDARILISRIDNLQNILEAASRYPAEHKADKLARFLAQFEAWNWYAQQALQTADHYLLRYASTKLTLYGCRLILAHNQILFPYHKWLTRVVRQAPMKPPNFEHVLEQLLSSPTSATVSTFYDEVKGFTNWPSTDRPWSMQFITDSELNWRSGHTPVDDL